MVALLQPQNRSRDIAKSTCQLLFDFPKCSVVSPVVRRRCPPCNEVDTSVATNFVRSCDGKRTDLASRRNVGPAARIRVQIPDSDKAKWSTCKLWHLPHIVGSDVSRVHKHRLDR